MKIIYKDNRSHYQKILDRLREEFPTRKFAIIVQKSYHPSQLWTYLQAEVGIKERAFGGFWHGYKWRELDLKAMGLE